MADLGYCKDHGVVEAQYEWFLATYHCPKCGNYVDPATDEQKAKSGDLFYRIID